MLSPSSRFRLFCSVHFGSPCPAPAPKGGPYVCVARLYARGSKVGRAKGLTSDRCDRAPILPMVGPAVFGRGMVKVYQSLLGTWTGSILIELNEPNGSSLSHYISLPGHCRPELLRSDFTGFNTGNGKKLNHSKASWAVPMLGCCLVHFLSSAESCEATPVDQGVVSYVDVALPILQFIISTPNVKESYRPLFHKNMYVPTSLHTSIEGSS